MPGRGTGAGIGLRHGEQPRTQPHGRGGHGLEQGSWSPAPCPLSALTTPFSPCQEPRSHHNSSPGPLLPPSPRPPSPPHPWEPGREQRLPSPSPGPRSRYGAGFFGGQDGGRKAPSPPGAGSNLSEGTLQRVNAPARQVGVWEDFWAGWGRCGQRVQRGRFGCPEPPPGPFPTVLFPPSPGPEAAMRRLEEDSEVYKMLQENRELRAAPRQSSTFRLLQEALEDEGGGEGRGEKTGRLGGVGGAEKRGWHHHPDGFVSPQPALQPPSPAGSRPAPASRWPASRSCTRARSAAAASREFGGH